MAGVPQGVGDRVEGKTKRKGDQRSSDKSGRTRTESRKRVRYERRTLQKEVEKGTNDRGTISPESSLQWLSPSDRDWWVRDRGLGTV